jgi:hypothetical protein
MHIILLLVLVAVLDKYRNMFMINGENLMFYVYDYTRTKYLLQLIIAY